MLRNHLLASQLDDLSWVVENTGAWRTLSSGPYEDLRAPRSGSVLFWRAERLPLVQLRPDRRRAPRHRRGVASHRDRSG